MKSALEQSIKEKIKAMARERAATFAELWRHLILERFLTRIALSPHKEKFVLKGGILLAKYIPIGRETQDLDFCVQKLSNNEASLRAILEEVCRLPIADEFAFELVRIRILDHLQLAYRGAEITLLAKFGATATIVHLDLGFGDRVEPIEYSMDLSATSKGPLFESRILLHCYPKEYIFAEKLETVVFRGATNTRMKDFHDLYSLVRLDALDDPLAIKAIQLVFQHRNPPLSRLPIAFSKDSFETLEKSWSLYCRKINIRKSSVSLPRELKEVISILNQWLDDRHLGF